MVEGRLQDRWSKYNEELALEMHHNLRCVMIAAVC